MKDADYTVKMDKQGGYLNTIIMPETEFLTNCIICGNDVIVKGWDNAPKVCDDCRKAIEYAKKLMEKDNKNKELIVARANCKTCIHKDICQLRTFSYCEEEVREKGCEHYKPKIDKDGLVLSKEEYKMLLEEARKAKNQCIKIELETIMKAEEQAIKETAEKFLQLAYDRSLEKSFIKKVEELAKSLGVEIKEN